MTEFLTMFGSSENGEEHLNICHHAKTHLGAKQRYYISSEMNLLRAEQGEQCFECKGNESNVNSNQLKNSPTLTSTMWELQLSWISCSSRIVDRNIILEIILIVISMFQT